MAVRAVLIAGYIFAACVWGRVFGMETSNGGNLGMDRQAAATVLRQLMTELESARRAAERAYIERLIEQQRTVIHTLSQAGK